MPTKEPKSVVIYTSIGTQPEIVRLVEAGRGRSAATLAQVRTKEVEAVIREYDAATGTDRLIRIPPADR